MSIAQCVWAVVMWALLATAAHAEDIDHDGLPDEWERAGGGTTAGGYIALGHDAVRVGRRDVIVLLARRDTKNFGDARADLARVRQFYADLPLVNEDGSTGVNLIYLYRDPLPEALRRRPYNDPAVREWIVPVEWRGYAHGYLLEDGPGGGGGTPLCADMSASGYDWRLVAHELGHQFHLDHQPRRQREASPLYTSIMNPDFNYTFNGDPEAVHFSRGRFAGVTLDERNLSEALAFPIGELRHLTVAPWDFTLTARGPSTTCVDWNRNGVPCEEGVRADVNGGSAVSIGETLALGPTSGAPALGAVRTSVYAVFPQVDGDGARWAAPFESRPRGAGLVLREVRNGALQETVTTVARFGVHSNPSVAGFGHRLAIAYVGAGGVPVVEFWKTGAVGGVVGPKVSAILPQFLRLGVSVDHVVLVAQPRETAATDVRLWLFAWSRATGATYVLELGDDAGATQEATRAVRPRPRARGEAYRLNFSYGAAVVPSTAPIALAYDRARRRVSGVIATTARTTQGVLQMVDLVFEDGRWVAENGRFVGGAPDPDWTADRAPALVIDD
ncbi:MAG: hypothetical protein NW200_05655, partial [Hyphomonadaceae bacterium]|nr:hypothetical protein [Hyphomonadaceae bacterium]